MKVNEIVKNNFQQLASSLALTEEIDKIGVVQAFDKDTVLLRENAYVKVIPLVISGLIKIYKEEENGNEVLLY